jgi:hypothetical protein
LDEWADGSGKNIDFSMGVYEKVYVIALKFLNKACIDLKHKEYMKSLRERWFKMGRQVFVPSCLNMTKLSSYFCRERLGFDSTGTDNPSQHDEEDSSEDWLASDGEV